MNVGFLVDDPSELPSPGIYNQQAPIPYEQVTGHPLIQAISLGSTTVPGQMPSYSATPGINPVDGNGTLSKRQGGHPLKSFSVPAPPPQSAPNTPQPKHIVCPQHSTSPYKKPSASVHASSTSPLSNQIAKTHSNPMQIITPRSHDVAFKSVGKDDRLAPSFSNEELTAEMANLEGLMKDLSAITASEFEC